MPSKKNRAKHRRSKRHRAARRYSPHPPDETRAAETVTIAWTVTVTAVLLCDFVAVVAHWYVATFPPAARLQLLGNLMLLSGSVLGVVCLALVPVVIFVRRLPPPLGFVWFAAFVAVAPILALVWKTWQ